MFSTPRAKSFFKLVRHMDRSIWAPCSLDVRSAVSRRFRDRRPQQKACRPLCSSQRRMHFLRNLQASAVVTLFGSLYEYYTHTGLLGEKSCLERALAQGSLERLQGVWLCITGCKDVQWETTQHSESLRNAVIIQGVSP